MPIQNITEQFAAEVCKYLDQDLLDHTLFYKIPGPTNMTQTDNPASTPNAYSIRLRRLTDYEQITDNNVEHHLGSLAKKLADRLNAEFRTAMDNKETKLVAADIFTGLNGQKNLSALVGNDENGGQLISYDLSFGVIPRPPNVPSYEFRFGFKARQVKPTDDANTQNA
jgi:hypothetical protein